MDFTADDVGSLANKLDALDLTEGESAAFMTILERAAERVEVAGFGLPHEHQNPLSARLSAILFFDEADSLFSKRSSPMEPHRILPNGDGLR